MYDKTNQTNYIHVRNYLSPLNLPKSQFFLKPSRLLVFFCTNDRVLVATLLSKQHRFRHGHRKLWVAI